MMSFSYSMNKKKIEENYFDCFRKAMADFPQGRIESTEAPDFLIHGKETIIGIELTELHHETPSGVKPQQELQAMQHRLVERAQEIYVSKGLPPVKVSIFIRGTYNIRKDQVQPLADALCRLVERNIPGPNSIKSEEYDWVNRSYFPELIIEISVQRFDVITETIFVAPGATWVPALSDSDVRRVIASKELKIPAYLLRCQQAWLIINTDIGLMSTWFDFDASLPLMPIKTKFRRVFIFGNFSKRLLEIEVEC